MITCFQIVKILEILFQLQQFYEKKKVEFYGFNCYTHVTVL